MTEEQIWNNENPVNDLDIDVPEWIDKDISPSDIAAIVQGGCSSGAYMPAVTYYDALRTMRVDGDNVLQYIQDNLGELPKPDNNESWSGMAVFYLSFAVEMWASSAHEQLEELDAA